MRTLTVVVLLLACFFCASMTKAESLDVVFIDVGAADGALIQCDGESMMIDTGGAGSWSHVKDVLDAQKVDKLKYLVLTHPDADHIGNAGRLISQYAVGTVILPPIENDTSTYGRMIDAIEGTETPTIYPYVGDAYTLGGAEIVVYGPHPVAYSNGNDWSVVLMVRYGGRSMLFTGDIEADAESDLVAYDKELPLKADILKVSHHGSASSSTAEFIKAVSPEYAVVSCASKRGKTYPDPATDKTLRECGVKDVLTTEKGGDVYVQLMGTGDMVLGYEGGNMEPSSMAQVDLEQAS